MYQLRSKLMTASPAEPQRIAWDDRVLAPQEADLPMVAASGVAASVVAPGQSATGNDKNI